jgi:hypothetical protein
MTRLITPWNVGELATPFMFLDYAEVAPGSQPLCGIQPHSTIASRMQSAGTAQSARVASHG